MFSDITRAYDLTDASMEIAVMLIVAFLLGFILRHLLSRCYGPCTTAKKHTTKKPEGAYSAFAIDDLKIVEGVGPKIEALLKENGVTSWEKLSTSSPAKIKEILTKGGDRFAMHDPASWPDQAALAHEGKWNELQTFQDLLIGGKVS